MSTNRRTSSAVIVRTSDRVSPTLIASKSGNTLSPSGRQLPAPHGGTEGEARADGGQHHGVAVVDQLLLDGLAQGDRQGSRTGVPDALDVRIGPREVEAQLPDDVLDE